jgi:hypothetical protein
MPLRLNDPGGNSSQQLHALGYTSQWIEQATMAKEHITHWVRIGEVLQQDCLALSEPLQWYQRHTNT